MTAIITPDPALLAGVKGVLLLVALNVLLGVAVAVKDGRFSFARLPSFLETEILAYVLGILVLSAVAMLDDTGAVRALALAAIAAYVAKMLAEIKDKVFTLFGVGKDIDVGGADPDDRYPPLSGPFKI